MDGSCLEEEGSLPLHPTGLWLDFAGNSCDMTIRIGGHKFHCHKCVLLPRCKFFRQLCTSVEKPRHMYVNMDSFPGGMDIFQRIVDFCYGRTIYLVADIKFLYLSHGATVLGMSTSAMFNGDNLEEYCDRFWQEYMLRSWRSVFKTLALLQQVGIHLPKNQIGVYIKKCLQALCMLIKKIEGTDLDDFVQKLVLLPEYQLDVILSALRWPQSQGKKIIDSFVLAAKTANPLETRALCLVAKSLIEGNIQYDTAEGQEQEIRADELKSSDEQGSLSIPKSAHTIIHLLVLIDSIPLKNETVMELRRNIFERILPEDLGTSSPELALKLITNFIEDEYKLLHFECTGTNFLLKYLRFCKSSTNPFPFTLFLEFAKALSLTLRDSHDKLYDEIKLYCKEVSLPQTEKQTLEHLVNCATLSSERMKEVILSGFSCALGDVVLALRNEVEELKDRLSKKRLRDCSCSCLHEDQTASKISKALKESKLEADLPNRLEGSQMSGPEEESRMQIIKNIQEEDVKPVVLLDMSFQSDFSKDFYISVMTTDYMSLSFPVDLFEPIAMAKKKILKEMELNYLTMPSNWHLVCKGKKLAGNATLHDNGIEMYGAIQMRESYTLMEKCLL